MMKYNLPRRTFVAHSTRGELVSSSRLDRESSLTLLFPKSSISFTQYLLYRTLAGFLVVAVTVTGSVIISKWLGVVTYECTPVCCLPIYLSSVRPSVRFFFLPSANVGAPTYTVRKICETLRYDVVKRPTGDSLLSQSQFGTNSIHSRRKVDSIDNDNGSGSSAGQWQITAAAAADDDNDDDDDFVSDEDSSPTMSRIACRSLVRTHARTYVRTHARTQRATARTESSRTEPPVAEEGKRRSTVMK